jgi:uncharacterized protein YndB with AHSA1/START domain
MDTAAATALRITRTYDATPEKVFNAWITPEALKRWFAPSDEFKTPEVTVDARVGGRYRIVMHAPDGQIHRVGGVYREFSPPKKLVFTWAWESTPEREMLVTVEFTARGNGTELVLVHERFADADARDHHEKGWNGCLGRLAQKLAA